MIGFGDYEARRAKMDEISRRPITVEVMREVSDDDLCTILYQRVLRLLPDSADLYECINRLSTGMKMLVLTILLEDEVNNGGFNQYFHNKADALGEETVHSFKLLGSGEFLDLVQMAFKQHRLQGHVLGEAKGIAASEGFNSMTLERFFRTYKQSVFGELDEKFHELNRPGRKQRAKTLEDLRKTFDTCTTLDRLRANYIRNNPHEFLG